MKKYVEKNKAKRRKYNKENKEKIFIQQKEYYEKNKEKVVAYHKLWYIENKDRLAEQHKEYYLKNKDKLCKNAEIYKKNRSLIDADFKLRELLRKRVRQAISVYFKTGVLWVSNDGSIDYRAIIEHLEPCPGDISEYHIDHIKPLCSFTFINKDDSYNIEEIKMAFAPENYQWLTAKENRLKGGNY